MLSRWTRLAVAALAALLFAPAALASIPSAADLALAPPALPDLAPASIEANPEPEICGVFCQRLDVRLDVGLFGGGAPDLLALDAWGNYRNPQELEASKNRFGFTGHLFDRETGTYYAKARYFDPGLGRFLSEDSYLGEIDNPPSLHRFLYANANPVRFTDPTGHYSWEELKQDAWNVKETLHGFVVDTARDAYLATGSLLTRAVRTFDQAVTPPQLRARYTGIDALSGQDVDAALEQTQFTYQTLSNLPQTGPSAIEAVHELGPRRSGAAIGDATVTTVAAIETAALATRGTIALAQGASRALKGGRPVLIEEAAELAAQVETTAPVGFGSAEAYQAEWARLAVLERTATIRSQLGSSAGFGETYGVQAVRMPNASGVHVVVASATKYGLPSRVKLLPGEQVVGRGGVG